MEPGQIVYVFQELADPGVGLLEIAVFVAIDLLILQRFEERFASRIVVGIPFAAHVICAWCCFRISVYCSQAYWTPRSEWCIRPGCGFRSASALCNAVTASSASSVRPSAQPITRRENASSTTAK